MDQINVGVVGVGRMGRNHCRVLSTIRSTRLIGVNDQDRDKAAEIADEFAVEAFDSPDQLMDEVDALIIATPTSSHFPLAERALEAGLDIFIEKPLAENEREARQIVDLAERSGAVVQVGHIERFNPAYRELKNLLIPISVLAIDSRRLSAFVGSNTDVDVIFDLLIHDIDLTLDMVGRMPECISAVGIQALSGTIDHVVSHLQFAGGPLVTLAASRVTEEKIRRIEVTALQAFIEADLLDKKVSVKRRTSSEYVNHHLQGVKYRQESLLERIHVPAIEPLFLELQHFVDCVVSRESSLVPASDGLRAIQIAEDIRAKAQADLVQVPSLTPLVLKKAGIAL
jgi:virulence factor